MDDFDEDDDDGGGDWITTFADMATLLMAFFVLLLSFAEMDVVKYQAVVGSMKEALGVEPDSVKRFQDEAKSTDPKCPKVTPEKMATPTPKQVLAEVDKKLKEQARVIRTRLSKLIKQSLVTVEKTTNLIVIRLPEKGMFGAGTATVSRKFKPVLVEISKALLEVEGEIIVAGHTDDRPINSNEFRSNWDLSSERAVSVLHELTAVSKLKPGSLAAVGYGATRPLVANDTKTNRSLNRRVEILVKKPAIISEAPKGLESVKKRAEKAAADIAAGVDAGPTDVDAGASTPDAASSEDVKRAETDNRGSDSVGPKPDVTSSAEVTPATPPPADAAGDKTSPTAPKNSGDSSGDQEVQ